MDSVGPALSSLIGVPKPLGCWRCRCGVPREHQSVFLRELLTVAALILAGSILYYIVSVFVPLPVTSLVFIQAVAALVLGVAAISLIARAASSVAAPTS